MKLLPVALNVAGQSTLVVGGGRVAARKVNSLLECEARVTLIAPQLCAELSGLRTRVKYFERVWHSGDAEGERYKLIFACTDCGPVNAQIAQEAKAANIWCNIADDGANSDFHGAAEVRRGEICIGITTGGGSPAVSRALKAQVEACIGDEWAQLLDIVSARRMALKEQIAATQLRGEVWRAILNSDALQLLKSGERTGAEQLIEEIMKRPAS